MGFDNKVYHSQCQNNGHDIRPIVTKNVFDGNTKTIVGNIEVFCTHCGMGLDEIRSLSKTRRRKLKEVAA